MRFIPIVLIIGMLSFAAAGDAQEKKHHVHGDVGGVHPHNFETRHGFRVYEGSPGGDHLIFECGIGCKITGPARVTAEDGTLLWQIGPGEIFDPAKPND